MRLDNLTFRYDERLVFQKASIKFGEPIDIIHGPSGCGKTTLLKVVSRLLEPESIETSDSPNHALMILQEDGLFPWLTGWDNILLLCRKGFLSKEQIQSHPIFPLVSSFIDQTAWTMSFGQRRSVELLRAFLANVDLLCLDEPFNFIDEQRKTAFIKNLYESPPAKMVIVSTHELSDFFDAARDYLAFDGQLPVTRLDRVSLEQYTG